jgi:hypothetical protein
LELPELIGGDGREDVTIRIGTLKSLREEVLSKGVFFRYLEKEAFLFRKGLGSILIRDGHEIIVDLSSATNEMAARPLILNAGMAILLHQRGLLALHASAVSVSGGAIIFLGMPGAGKSTTAAAFYQHGNAVLSDEVVAIHAGEGVPLVYASCPLLRLMPEVISSLGGNYTILPKVHPAEDKRIQMAERNFSPGPHPLRRIYILEQGSMIEIRPINIQEAIVELIRHSYAASLLKTSGASSHLNQCSKLIEQVPIKRLKKKNDLRLLPEIVQMIEADLV